MSKIGIFDFEFPVIPRLEKSARFIKDMEKSFFSDVGNFKFSYPPYNIIKKDGKIYLEIGVAGFSKEDLTVTVVDKILKIEGSQKEGENLDLQYLYKGLSTRDFSIGFTLHKDAEILGAVVVDGKLIIELSEELPEETPKVIKIRDGESGGI